MDYISKKDLLSHTGISYGQLYRWKREGLIPEEWFIKRASYTGQETFFPKEQVLSRISTILGMKENHSLEKMAVILSADSCEGKNLSPLDVDEINKRLASVLTEEFNISKLSLAQIALIICAQQALPHATLENLATLVASGLKIPLNSSDYTMVIYEFFGKYGLALSSGNGELILAPPASKIAKFYLGAATDLLTGKYSS